jgi:hypothetical protein
MRWIAAAPVLLRTYGWRGLPRRAVHEMRRACGLFQNKPRHPPSNSVGTRRVAYGPRGAWSALSGPQRQRIIDRAQRVLDGWYEAFGHDWRRMPQTPQDWRRHPRTGFEFPMLSWWKVPLMPAGQDIKEVWEPARFGWAYDLVRAFALTGDRRCARLFYDRLRQWQRANPPFVGPQWACGQEVAIRALALLHGEDGLPTPDGDAEAAKLLVSELGWCGERIADAVGYALSQRNNHGLSEAAALVHLGIRLKSVHPGAGAWLHTGARLLEEQILDQFAPDGWYAQHSLTYLRVALDQTLYAQRALCAIGQTLSAAALERIDAAVRLVMNLVDECSGEAPNHGANDGGRALPLSAAPYRDFRPLLTLAGAVRNSCLPADVPADTTVLAWLDQRLPPCGPERADGVVTGPSGWAIVRLRGCMLFMRAGGYAHRPSHLDALHTDIRMDGKEVVVDPGTYAYSAAPPWNNGLASALVHNGPLLHARETAERGPRFLWLSWPTAHLVAAEYTGNVARLFAQTELVSREVIVAAHEIRVLDRSRRPDVASLHVNWLLHPDAPIDCINATPDSQCIEAREGDVSGWFSPTYGLRLASRVVRVSAVVSTTSPPLQTIIRRPETHTVLRSASDLARACGDA